MRNLYSRLKIDPSASTDEVRAAIAACRHATLRDDAAEVLLVPERRRSYDDLHSVLSDIGQLRAALALSHGDNWRGDAATDYTVPAAPARPRYAEFKAQMASRLARQAQRREDREREVRAQRLRRSFSTRIVGLGATVVGFGGALLRMLFQLAKAAAIVAAVGVAIYVVRELVDMNDRPGSVSRPVVQAPRFSVQPVARPYTGYSRQFAGAAPSAPLEIRTSSGVDYLVKLVDAYRDTDALDVFVRGGETVQVEVPRGSYVVKYASGVTWYGYDYLFGPDTAYNKAETVFEFRNDGYRYTLTLYKVRDGNLRTKSLTPAEF